MVLSTNIMPVHMSVKSNFDIQKYYDDGTFDRNDIVKLQEELEEENIPYNSEDIVASFIYLCDGDLERAKSVLIKVYLCKKNIPELFHDRSCEDESIKKQWKTIGLAASPEYFNEIGPIFYFRFVGAPAAEFDSTATIKAFIMATDSYYYEKLLKGCTILVDLKHMYFSHIFRINIRLLRKIMKLVLGGLDQLVSQIHFVNGGFVLDKLVKILKMVADKQIFEKFKFHKHDMDWEDFYRDCIPRNFLPSDYGGTLEPFEVLQEKLWDRFVTFKENYRIEESFYIK